MTISMCNDFVLVQKINDVEQHGLIAIAGDKTEFCKGKVLHCREEDYVGKTAIFAESAAKELGLGFGKDHFVVKEEDVVAFVSEE